LELKIDGIFGVEIWYWLCYQLGWWEILVNWRLVEISDGKIGGEVWVGSVLRLVGGRIFN
jgi:hypothetical protein